MAEVLYVSKPVVPPWNDSSKNLVRDLTAHLARHTARVMGLRGEPSWAPSRGVVEPVYPLRAGGFAPGLKDNARVLGRLAAGPRCDLWHFFFAPNPRSSQMGRVVSRLRRVPTIQTVCSAPRDRPDLRRLLFADRTVVLSRRTEARLLDAGVEPERLCRIPPCVAPLPVPTEAARRDARRAFGLPSSVPLVVYPGDLEFGGGAERIVDAMALRPMRDVHVAMACRVKTPGARDVERALRARVAERGLDGRITWIGETSHIHALLGTADVVALPSGDLFAKMDYPLVLLEAMSMGRPVVVARGTPAEELAEDDAAIVVPADPDAVATAIAGLLSDDGSARSVGEAARASVLERFSPDAMARSYERLYDDTLAAR